MVIVLHVTMLALFMRDMRIPVALSCAMSYIGSPHGGPSNVLESYSSYFVAHYLSWRLCLWIRLLFTESSGEPFHLTIALSADDSMRRVSVCRVELEMPGCATQERGFALQCLVSLLCLHCWGNITFKQTPELFGDLRLTSNGFRHSSCTGCRLFLLLATGWSRCQV